MGRAALVRRDRFRIRQAPECYIPQVINMNSVLCFARFSFSVAVRLMFRRLLGFGVFPSRELPAPFQKSSTCPIQYNLDVSPFMSATVVYVACYGVSVLTSDVCTEIQIAPALRSSQLHARHTVEPRVS